MAIRFETFVGIKCTPMLRLSCSLRSALRRAPPQTASISPYASLYTPTHRALPLSDAQRKTIYALSTAPAKSGVAIIRVSGPDALHVWRRMVRSTRATHAHTDQNENERKLRRTHEPNRDHNDEARHQQLLPETWKLQRCHVVDPQSYELLDDALAVFFRGASLCPKASRYLPLTRMT
jgi:GTP-binding protein TrmE N-terminus